MAKNILGLAVVALISGFVFPAGVQMEQVGGDVISLNLPH